MFVMLSSCVEMESRGCAAARVGVDELVMFWRGGSRMCGGIVIVCSAFMVAEGGVFSPRIALCRVVGVCDKSYVEDGDGVPNCPNLVSSLPK
jgi:hypothetical protein